MTATPIQSNALHLPLRDESVDLLISSPPYFSLRSYRDSGEHFHDQIGSEATAQEFLDALWAVMREGWRVLKPTGSCFINLGDKRSGTGGANGNTGLGLLDAKVGAVDPRTGPRNNTKQTSGQRFASPAGDGFRGVRAKSKMLLPHRFAIGCEDGMADPEGIGWIVRSDMVWSKPNGLPESVVDRVRDSHEYWFHLVKQGRYFSAVDEIREAYTPGSAERIAQGFNRSSRAETGNHHNAMMTSFAAGDTTYEPNPLGKLPGSVWTIASEPLTIPEAVKAHYDLPDHFAAFPQEWPRRLILGWSPSGVCVGCGEGRRPVVAKERQLDGEPYTGPAMCPPEGRMRTLNEGVGNWRFSSEATITGYACACNDASAPTKPAVVVDIFGGTGTVAGVARQLGRTGISFDLSHDYSRLAAWFLRDGRRFAKTSSRTDKERQGVML